jgi:branched-chain amino acid transport system permease protein
VTSPATRPTISRVAQPLISPETSQRYLAWPARLVALLVVVLAGLYYQNYRLSVAELILIDVIVGLGLNIFMGLCGQANFGVSAFTALGSFGSGLLEVKAGLNPFVALIPTLIGGAIVAYLLSFVLLRLREMSLAIGTIAVALAVYAFLESVLPLDWGGGSNGLGVPLMTINGWYPGPRFFYYYAAAWMVLVYIGYRRLQQSRVGRAWRSIRMDEGAAAAAGINSQGYKRLAYVLSNVVAVLAGTLLIQQSGFTSADSFGIFSNLTILLIVVVGGEGSAPGTVLGAAILVLLTQETSSISTGPTFIYGAVLFVVIRFLPRGIWYYLSAAASFLTRKVAGRLRLQAGTEETHA